MGDLNIETLHADFGARVTGVDLDKPLAPRALDDIRRAICLLIEKAHTLAEGAGATALAGAMKLGQELKGEKAGSGGQRR